MIASFFRSLMDLAGHQTELCTIENMFTNYRDIMNNIFGITEPDKWRDEDFAMLAERIKEFKNNGRATIGEYKKSNMCTVKWHALDYICNDIKRNGILLL